MSREQQVIDEATYEFYTFQQLKEKIKLLALPEDLLLWNSDSSQEHFLKPAYLNETLTIDCSMTIGDSIYVNHGTFHIPLTLDFVNDTREIQLLLTKFPNSIPTLEKNHKQIR